MKISRLLSYTAVVASMAVVGAGVANAQGISVSFVSVTPGTGSNGAPVGQFAWDYALSLTPNTGLRSLEPSSVTFYDFSGLTVTPTFLLASTGAFSTSGDTFVPGLQLLGKTPPDVVPIFGDNPALNNAVFLFSGTNFTNPSTSVTSIALGDAIIPSSQGTSTGNFVGVTTGSLDSQFGNAHDTTGAINGPNVFVATPEPGTWAMFVGMGISGLAFTRRRKARK